MGTDMVIVLKARDAASRVFRTVSRAARRLGGSMRTLFGGLRRQLLSLRTLLAGALVAGVVRTFAEFEKGIATVGTLVDGAQDSLRRFSAGVKEVALETGQSLGDLNKALFDLVSAGVDASKSTEVLGVASKLAVAGATNVASATKGLVSILKAYNLDADRATEVSDALFQAQKKGITTVAAIAENIGKLSPVARQAGISFDEMLASLAALTAATGLSTEEAITALRQSMLAAIKPNEQAAEAVKRLGIQWDAATLKAKGFLGLIEQLGKDGVEPTTEEMVALGGSVRGFVGLAALANDNAKVFRDTLESMGDKAGATEDAFDQMNKTLAQQIDRLKAAFAVLAVEIGESLKPFLEDVIDRLNEFAQWARRNRRTIAAFAEAVGRTFGRVFEFIGKKLREFFDLIRESAKQGALINDFLQIFIGLVDGIVQVLLAGLPLLLKTVQLIGRQLALALINTFVGETKEKIARALFDESLSGFFKRGLIKLGIPDEEINRLADLGRQLIAFEDAQKRNAEAGMQNAEVLEDIARLEREVAAAREAGNVVLAKRLEEQLKVRRFDVRFPLLGDNFAELIEQTKREIGGNVFEGVFDADQAALAREAETFITQKLRPALQGAIDRTRGRLAPGTRNAFTALANLDDVAGLASDIQGFFGRAIDTARTEQAQNKLRMKLNEIFTPIAQRAEAVFGPALEAFKKLGARAADFFNLGFEEKQAADPPKVTGLGRILGTGFQIGAELLKPILRAVQELNRSPTLMDHLTEIGRTMGLTVSVSFTNAFGQQQTLTRLKKFSELFAEGVIGLIVQQFQALQGLFSDVLTDILTGDFENIEQSFARFFQNLIRAFADFVSQLLVQALALQFLKSLGFNPSTLGFAKGGVAAGGFVPFQAFQSGGVATRPTLGLVGEGGKNEAIVPLPDNRSIPVKFVGQDARGSSGPAVVLQINVSAVDGQDAARFIIGQADTIKSVFTRAVRSDPSFRRSAGVKSTGILS